MAKRHKWIQFEDEKPHRRKCSVCGLESKHLPVNGLFYPHYLIGGRWTRKRVNRSLPECVPAPPRVRPGVFCPMKKVRLFRHGQSESNVGGKTDWPTNVHLTDTGRAQAVLVAERAASDCSMVVISGYVRTAETAKPLLERVHVPMQVWPVHEFTYLNVEECSHTTHSERGPMRKRYWDKMDPDYVDGPGAESYSQLLARVSSFLGRIRTLSPTAGHLDVFTHADFIRAVLFQLMVPGGTIVGFRKFCQTVAVANAACVRLLVDEHGVHASGPDDSHIPGYLVTGLSSGSGSSA